VERGAWSAPFIIFFFCAVLLLHAGRSDAVAQEGRRAGSTATRLQGARGGCRAAVHYPPVKNATVCLFAATHFPRDGLSGRCNDVRWCKDVRGRRRNCVEVGARNAAGLVQGEWGVSWLEDFIVHEREGLHLLCTGWRLLVRIRSYTYRSMMEQKGM